MATRRMTNVTNAIRAELAEVRRQIATIQADARARIQHLLAYEHEYEEVG